MRSARTSALLAALEAAGIPLLQDRVLPGAATLVAGEPISGSWWADPRSHEIFRRVGELAEHPDVLVTKRVNGKVTFVHRRLRTAVLAVATGQEPWQPAGLSTEARARMGAGRAGREPGRLRRAGQGSRAPAAGARGAGPHRGRPARDPAGDLDGLDPTRPMPRARNVRRRGPGTTGGRHRRAGRTGRAPAVACGDGRKAAARGLSDHGSPS